MIFAAIDPGQDGAIALFEDKKLIGVNSLYYRKIGKQLILEADQHRMEMQINLGGHVRPDAVVVEEVNFIRGQGGVSSFSFGQRFGEAKSLALMLSYNTIFVSPQKWKKAVGLIGQDKNKSAILAADIYPNHADEFVEDNKRCKGGKKYYDGRGDAVMIGLAALKLNLLGDK